MKTWVKVLLWVVSLVSLGIPGLIVAFILIMLIEKKNGKEQKKTNVNNNTTLFDFQSEIVDVLDTAFEFKKAYHYAVPNEWFILFVSQDNERIEQSERYYTYEGYIKVEIIVGNWWDYILCEHKVVCDNVMSLFTFNKDEKTFTYKIRTGYSTCCAYPRDEVNLKLQEYLDEYEKSHPEIKFKRKSGSASIEYFP